jgi:hypothetical protein
MLSTCKFGISFISSGITSGLACIITGSFGVAAAKNSSHCIISTHLAFAIISIILSLVPIIWGTMGVFLHGEQHMTKYILSEDPLQICEGNITTTDFDSSFIYYSSCNSGCCFCDVNSNNNDAFYEVIFKFDFAGEIAGICINSVILGLGLASLVFSTISAALFCQARTCCPKRGLSVF